MQPLISVLIPVYNTREYLPACMESVLKQTYQTLDIVLVDDGSTDGSGALCDAYAAADSRVRVIHQPNGGVAAARNALLAAARGEYLIWVDSDDVCAPDMVEYLFNGLIANGADAAQCAFTSTGPQGWTPPGADCRSAEILKTTEDYADALSRGRAHLFLLSKIFQSRFFKDVTIPPFSRGEDLATLFAQCGRISRYALLPGAKYYYRHRQESLCHTGDATAFVDGYEFALSIIDSSSPAHGYMLYQYAHAVSMALSWERAENVREQETLHALYGRLRASRKKLLACPYIGPLGRLEIRLLCTGLPGRFAFSALCQKIFEFRAERRRI